MPKPPPQIADRGIDLRAVIAAIPLPNGSDTVRLDLTAPQEQVPPTAEQGRNRNTDAAGHPSRLTKKTVNLDLTRPEDLDPPRTVRSTANPAPVDERASASTLPPPPAGLPRPGETPASPRPLAQSVSPKAATLPPPPSGLFLPADATARGRSNRPRRKTGPRLPADASHRNPVGSDLEDWIEADSQPLEPGAEAEVLFEESVESLARLQVGSIVPQLDPDPLPQTASETPKNQNHSGVEGPQDDEGSEADGLGILLSNVPYHTGRDPSTVHPPLSPDTAQLLARVDGSRTVAELFNLEPLFGPARIVATLEQLWRLELIDLKPGPAI